MSGSKVRPEDVGESRAELEIGARLSQGPSNRLVETVFARELAHQSYLFEALGLIDIAHTLAALELGTLPAPQGRALLAALLDLQELPDSFMVLAERGDLYTNREAWLAEQTDTAAWLGGGRARREAITSAFIVVVRADLLACKAAFARLGQTLAELALLHKASTMPDYTYLQAAQPSTYGHYLLSFAYPLLRDLDRLDLLFAEYNRSPMGCGSANGSRLPQGREFQAKLLGFSSLVEHARDAMWQADNCIHCVALLNSFAITMSRLAEDLQIFSTREFGLIELSDSHARASKVMPQKKNPFALTHIRLFANQMTGLLTTISALSRTPTGQPDNRLAVYSELPGALRHAAEVALLLQEVLMQATLNCERGLDLIENGWTMATDLAEALVMECGLSFREAHRLLGYLSTIAVSPDQLSAAAVVECCAERFGKRIDLSEDQWRMALDPIAALQDRKEAGGAAKICVERMAQDCFVRFTEFQVAAEEKLAFFNGKEADLLAMAKVLAAS